MIEIKDERTIHFADHEVLLAFDKDWDAMGFREWWADHGCEAFNAWWESKGYELT